MIRCSSCLAGDRRGRGRVAPLPGWLPVAWRRLLAAETLIESLRAPAHSQIAPTGFTRAGRSSGPPRRHADLWPARSSVGVGPAGAGRGRGASERASRAQRSDPPADPREDPHHRCERRAIGPIKLGAVDRPTEHRELVAQEDQLSAKPHKERSVFTASSLLREARRQRGLRAQAVPTVCILDPDGDVTRYVHEAAGASPDPTVGLLSHTPLADQSRGPRGWDRALHGGGAVRGARGRGARGERAVSG